MHPLVVGIGIQINSKNSKEPIIRLAVILTLSRQIILQGTCNCMRGGLANRAWISSKQASSFNGVLLLVDRS
ncbi:hypothetical protein SEVIR_5G457950v4 [Setaria viridis]